MHIKKGVCRAQNTCGLAPLHSLALTQIMFPGLMPLSLYAHGSSVHNRPRTAR